MRQWMLGPFEERRWDKTASSGVTGGIQASCTAHVSRGEALDKASIRQALTV